MHEEGEERPGTGLLSWLSEKELAAQPDNPSGSSGPLKGLMLQSCFMTSTLTL